MNIYVPLYLFSLSHNIAAIIFVVLCNIFLKETEKISESEAVMFYTVT